MEYCNTTDNTVTTSAFNYSDSIYTRPYKANALPPGLAAKAWLALRLMVEHHCFL